MKFVSENREKTKSQTEKQQKVLTKENQHFSSKIVSAQVFKEI